MDARTKALRAHRKRLQARRMKRVEVTLREQDAALIRRLVADLRRNDANADRLRFVLRGTLAEHRGTRIAEALYDPVIAGPEFDKVFEEIERFRHQPEMMKVRDIDL
jgi:hypothetical protein